MRTIAFVGLDEGARARAALHHFLRRRVTPFHVALRLLVVGARGLVAALTRAAAGRGARGYGITGATVGGPWRSGVEGRHRRVGRRRGGRHHSAGREAGCRGEGSHQAGRGRRGGVGG